MGGGLFGSDLALNPKCLVFSALLIGVYYLPKPKSISNNVIISFLLATSGYIIMAWYDVLYDCNDKFKPTLFGWMTKKIKPKSYNVEYEKLSYKTQKTIRQFDIIVLLIVALTFILPFFLRK